MSCGPGIHISKGNPGLAFPCESICGASISLSLGILVEIQLSVWLSS